MTEETLTLAPQKPMTADDVREVIRKHYGPNGERYSTLFEVRDGAAWSAKRSVDSVVMSLWPSLGLELQGIEIKVARSDWLNELKNPKKASDVIHHFDRWWLVAPRTVAKLDEIPGPWGWMEPTTNGLAVIKAAPKNENVQACSRSFLAVLMRMTARRDEVSFKAALKESAAKQRHQFDAELEQHVLKRMGELKAEATEWQKVRKLLDDTPDGFIYQPAVIEAVRVVMKSGVAQTYGGLRSLMKEIDRMKESVSKIADELSIEPEKPLKRRK